MEIYKRDKMTTEELLNEWKPVERKQFERDLASVLRENAIGFCEDVASAGWVLVMGGLWRNVLNHKIGEYETRTSTELYDEYLNQDK